MTLRVLTLNLWNDSGPWDARQERVREWIDRLTPDVISFQEALRSDDWDQVSTLLDGRGYHIDYVRAAGFWRDRSMAYGNAIASRWPIAERHPLVLPDRGDGELRAALTAQIDAPFGTLSFTATHLNWKLHQSEIRCAQVGALARHVLALRPDDGFPPVVAGDFNADPDSDEIRFMRGGHAIDGFGAFFNDAWLVAGTRGDRGETWSNQNDYAARAWEPDRRIDYIFAGYPRRDGAGRIEHCRVVCNDACGGVWPSDHFGVYAELRTTPDGRLPILVSTGHTPPGARD